TFIILKGLGLMENVTFVPRTPKRNGSEVLGKAGFYDFYAGYSTLFVADVLRYWDLPVSSVVLDPWNGSGTTTDIASKMGYTAIGYDLNPVMFIVAKAREIQITECLHLYEAKKIIIDRAKDYQGNPTYEADPLAGWFTSE